MRKKEETQISEEKQLFSNGHNFFLKVAILALGYQASFNLSKVFEYVHDFVSKDD